MNDVYDIVTQYQLEANTLAINKERTKCVLLTSDETLQCMNPVTDSAQLKVLFIQLIQHNFV